MKIFLGSDQGGVELKGHIIEYLKELKIECEDFGCFNKEPADYPDYAKKVCHAVLENNNSFGILICGTGIGMSIAANKIKGIRCAHCTEQYSAKMARFHNNANVLALGGRILGVELAKCIVKVFMETGYEGGRHEKRLAKIKELENNN